PRRTGGAPGRATDHTPPRNPFAGKERRPNGDTMSMCTISMTFSAGPWCRLPTNPPSAHNRKGRGPMHRRSSAYLLLVLAAVAAVAFGGTRALGVPRAATATPTLSSTVPGSPHPPAVVGTFGSCPAQGTGGGSHFDPDLNRMKNRVDAVAPDEWQRVSIAAIVALPSPEATESRGAQGP